MELEPSPDQYNEMDAEQDADSAKDRRFLPWLNKLLHRRLIAPEIALVLGDETSLAGPDRINTPATTKKPEVLSKESHYTQEALTAKKVLERVAEAADMDMPIEKDYELRHEVKDIPPQVIGAEAVGSILSKKPVPLTKDAAAEPTRQVSNNTDNDQPATSLAVQPGLYRRAVKLGFLSAIMVILAVVSLFLLT